MNLHSRFEALSCFTGKPPVFRGPPFQGAGVVLLEMLWTDANKTKSVLFDLYDLIG